MTHRKNFKKSQPAIEVHVTRGNLSESVHLVDALVLDHQGQTVMSFGHAEQVVTYPRSAIKFLQAVSFVESGAYTKWDLDQRHLSIACASHNGEHKHTELILNWLAKIGCQEENLICGPHFPYDEMSAKELILRGEHPHRRHNNCSGKHTSMLSTLKCLGESVEDYGAYDHPLQKTLRRNLSELFGEEMDRSPWGVDGCGIPTYGVSLKGMAKGLQKFLPDPKDLSAERAEAIRLIREAVLAEPYYVGGQGDFCTDVMGLTKGRVLIKSGAEGVFAGAFLHQGLSFAAKVRDGNARAARVAVGEILRLFEGLTEDEFLQLSSHTRPVVKNWGNLTVGKIFVPNLLMS